MRATHWYLEEIARIQRDLLEQIWPNGRNPEASWDGRHYILPGTERPVSVSQGEAYLLANIVALSRPSVIFEIGTGFGYSMAWLGISLIASRIPGKLITLDNYTEGELGQRGLGIAHDIADRLNISSIVTIAEGTSPDDVPRALSEQQIDVAFIDANHYGPHPTLDYDVTNSLTRATGAILFHDNDPSRYTVSSAVEKAADDGWQIHRFETSCSLTAAFEDPRWRGTFQEALDAAVSGRLLTTDQ